MPNTVDQKSAGNRQQHHHSTLLETTSGSPFWSEIERFLSLVNWILPPFEGAPPMHLLALGSCRDISDIHQIPVPKNQDGYTRIWSYSPSFIDDVAIYVESKTIAQNVKILEKLIEVAFE